MRELFAAAVLFLLAMLWTFLSWGRLHDPMQDQGWYLQVAARVATGDVLYRDVIWMYGPLPVYLLAALFQWLGINVVWLFLLYYVLALLGCLLTYRVARFFLSPLLALLGTVSIFLGGWWGGFVSYTLAYTGAVPMGAVLGLSFVVCLLSYLRTERLIWLLGAGVATGGALLTKPEFAVATLGTGLTILGAIVVYPPGKATDRAAALRALAIYMGAAGGTAGLGYGLLALQAGWADVWAGVSGYDQDVIMLHEWPPWGTPVSWYYIASGLGLYLLLTVVLTLLLIPPRSIKRMLGLGLVAGLGLGLAVMPWALIFRAEPGLKESILTSRTAFFQEMIRGFWAPGMVFLTLALAVLVIRWGRAIYHRQKIDRREWELAVLVIYSILANVRSFLHPTGTLHFHYLHSLFPLLLYAAVRLLPQAVERWAGSSVRQTRAGAFLVTMLCIYAMIGLDWDLAHLRQINTQLVSSRGQALYFSDSYRRRPWKDLLQYLQLHTRPGDRIVIIGPEPGFYFWSGRTNPLRQDTILPGMSASPADAAEFVAHLEQDCPELVIVPQSVTKRNVWFWNLDVGREAYQDMEVVWQYLADRYRLQTVLGGEEWGYAIFQPGVCQ